VTRWDLGDPEDHLSYDLSLLASVVNIQDSLVCCSASSEQLFASRRNSEGRCRSCQPGRWSCGSTRSSWSCSGAMCTVSSLQHFLHFAALYLFSDTCEHAAATPAAVGSASSSQGLQSEEPLEEGHQGDLWLRLPRQGTSGTYWWVTTADCSGT